MIDGKKYIETIELFFSFLVREFNFDKVKATENGNAFYDLEYRDAKRVISISYESIDDYFLVIIFILKNGELPDYDDKTYTLHLDKLNRTIFLKIDKTEVEENNLLFNGFETSDSLERKLLKSAKELRLVLKYWDRFEYSDN